MRFNILKIVNKNRIKNILLFIICICIGGFVSIGLEQDASFDLWNYHLYIPYAFLHNRLYTDLIVAGVAHTFFNPLADIPYFLAFCYFNDWPRLTGFLLGTYYGLVIYAVSKWTTLHIIKGETLKGRMLQLGVIAFAVTGLATLFQANHPSNEELMGFLAVIASYILFCGTDDNLHFNLKNVLIATFLVSFATGLKYTAAPAACGIGLCCLVLLVKNKASLKNYLYIAGTALGGFLLTDGYFLYQKWKLFGNPLFPFFNHIFKSPFLQSVSLPNGTGDPSSWQEFLFLPFLRLNLQDLGEYRLDFRLMLGLVSFVLVCIGGFLYIKKTKSFKKNIVLLLSLYIGTYIPWIILFGNTRYSIFLEILSCLLFTLVLKRIFSKECVCVILIVLSLFNLVKPYHKRARIPFGKKNFTFLHSVYLPDDALVLVAGHHSAVVPFLNPKARYIGGVNFRHEKMKNVFKGDIRSVAPLPELYYTHNFPIREEIQKHQGPIYLLTPFVYWMWEEPFWEEYGIDISPKYCQIITTNLNAGFFPPLALCLVNN